MNIRKVIPNILTFINMSLGITSILLDDIMLASSFILLAAIFDRYDGKVARALKAESEFGKQLDSLSDIVSFGIAPAILVFRLNLFKLGFAGYAIVILFILCGAFRLARFNILNIKDMCVGLPITIAGFILALNCLLHCLSLDRFNEINIFFTVTLTLFLSVLMVMKFQFKKI
ncbi:CDP-diacylglycerol---serine O-phosphatidyltransferase [Alkalithermobacter thermoalcaliphilus JW-YL-7 = DSM 7308]|uniref:CDP-diacylglycerol--serine O-phosphatidyltransferase n=1 Tax=Alkalithermobacter thermoalcaliphilus JW-YL-7 = DSM 7308 TaxID=1121328 RepID=A0A150FNX2_CLOPD|nr:CDP-diacylglycerol/serine O-phosphatidyltransferase [[Clostridium] paradoxum JW-YL-7 = DSM 7308]SHK85401.1 CDP-diacylglycerol---serine O-phosphatidyltransferase [[Clostridium] paradoxum JW-YL-7 = DSM 7308]